MTVNQGGATKATLGSNTVLTGGTITLRSSTNNNDKFVLTADSAKLFDNNTERASFGATTTIGNTSTDHISIDSDSVDIKYTFWWNIVFDCIAVLGLGVLIYAIGGPSAMLGLFKFLSPILMTGIFFVGMFLTMGQREF